MSAIVNWLSQFEGDFCNRHNKISWLVRDDNGLSRLNIKESMGSSRDRSVQLSPMSGTIQEAEGRREKMKHQDHSNEPADLAMDVSEPVPEEFILLWMNGRGRPSRWLQRTTKSIGRWHLYGKESTRAADPNLSIGLLQ